MYIAIIVKHNFVCDDNEQPISELDMMIWFCKTSLLACLSEKFPSSRSAQHVYQRVLALPLHDELLRAVLASYCIKEDICDLVQCRKKVKL